MQSSDDEQPEDMQEQLVDAILKLLRAGGLGGSRSAWESVKSVIEQHADVLLTGAAENAIENYLLNKIAELNDAGADERRRWMALYPDTEKLELLRRCRRQGIEVTFAAMGRKLAIDWMWTFINFLSTSERAANWAKTKDLLTSTFSNLLSPQARSIFTSAPWLQSLQFSDDQITLPILFNRIYDYGLDEAFQDLIEFNTDVPPALRSGIRAAVNATNQYRQRRDRISLDEAVTAWESIVSQPEFLQSTLHTQRKYLLEAGNTYEFRFRERSDPVDLGRAIDFWRMSTEKKSSPGRRISPELLYYLGYSHERMYHRYLSMAEEVAVDHPAEASATMESAHESMRAAIHCYEEAYAGAKAKTDGVPPAPMNTEAENAFSKWVWLRRQKSRYLNSAGVVYFNRYHLTDDSEDLDLAIDRCREATKLADEEEMRAPFLFDDLGVLLVTRYRESGRESDLTEGIAAYKRALHLSDESQPLFGVEAAAHYGRLLYELGRWREARSVLESGHLWIQKTRIERTSERSRLELGAFTETLYQTLVSCCLLDADEASAFKYASASKGRTFVDMLAEARVTVDSLLLSEPNLSRDLAPYLQVRNEIDQLRNLLVQRGRPRPLEQPGHLEYTEDQLFDTIAELRNREKLLWDDLTSRYHMLAAMGDVEPLNADIASTLSDELGATLIDYYHHSEGWCAFVITPGKISARPLPHLNDELLHKLSRWVENLRGDACAEGIQEPEKHLLMEWYDAALRPIANDLAEAEISILAPFGAMHSIPFGAAIDQVAERYAIDLYDLAFTPSLGALWTIWQHRRTLTNSVVTQELQHLLAVAYPGEPNSESYLENAALEVDSVLACFPRATQTPLLGPDATPDAVIAHAPGQDVIHLCCHATFDPSYPFQSGLLLSNGWLTVRRIISELKLDHVRLVTLSACVTAKSDRKAGDELAGLTQAVLTAQASSVVSSLWPVNDAATRVLFSYFYERVRSGATPIRALREAAIAVRHRKEWNHPYFWCPFIVVGLGHLQLAPAPDLSTTKVGTR